MPKNLKSNEETPKEKLARLEMMAEGGETWDLSDNDMAAIDWVLSRYKQAKSVLMAMASEDYCNSETHVFCPNAIKAREALKSFV